MCDASVGQHLSLPPWVPGGLRGDRTGGGRLSGCGSSDGGSGSGRTTVEWWNITTTEPAKKLWAERAKEFEAAHPDVKIKIVTLENEAYKSKMTALTTSGKLPDIYHTWGGGVLKQQVDAGLVEDLTDKVSSWTKDFVPAALAAYEFEDRSYAVPFDIGMVGFWYNKALFKKAKIDSPPTTWSGYLDAVQALKDAGITPIALAGKEKWPGMYYWAYLSMRVAGLEAMQKAATDADFTGEGFVTAGQHLKDLVALEPFQKGFLGAAYSTPNGEAAAMGNGKAAMELMGQWAPVVQGDAGKGIGEDLGFFSFPPWRADRARSPRCSAGAAGTRCARALPTRRWSS